MKIAINLLLLCIIAGLTYVLVSSIREPVEFQEQKAKRKGAVVKRLQEIRTSQEMYREIEGKFAKNFEDLSQTLRTKDLQYVSILGDKDDPTFDIANLQYDTTFVAAIDSVNSKGINLDSLMYVPYSSGEKFYMSADTITYQLTLTHVVEAGTQWKNFMGKYASDRYKQYDDLYDPSKTIKFGSMNSPNLSGNWE